jgi:phage baseplate assembly protein W
MAVKIKTLKTLSDTYTEKDHVYKDLAFDLSLYSYEPPGFRAAVPSKDIKVSFDARAVVNSLFNLFNTRPGQRFLFPEYGISLLPYVFTQITPENGELIGNVIMSGIRRFEPRVTPRRIIIDADPDNNQYIFNLYYEIPMLGETLTSRFITNAKDRTFISLSTERT